MVRFFRQTVIQTLSTQSTKTPDFYKLQSSSLHIISYDINLYFHKKNILCGVLIFASEKLKLRSKGYKNEIKIKI